MTTSPDYAALVSAVGDRYVVERELGHGGMATVYLAQDIKHARPVAIKVLRPEFYSAQFAERFLAEIRVTASLQHPHILPLFDSGASGELLYYVMPYVTGETLRERITREHQLPIADAVRIAGDVAGALDYAHRRGVIHRDIKPENILFHDGAALVADFGIAYSVAANTGGERLTATGISIGTPAYMSPEQASGERVVDARSDVYALGAVLYEMLAGTPPHTGSSAQAIMAKVLTTDPAPIATLRHDVSPTLTAAVTRAIARDPSERWESAAALAHALHEPIAVATPPLAPRAEPQMAPRALSVHWQLTIGAVAVVAASVAAWARYWPLVSPPPVVLSKKQVTFNGNVENSALSPDGRFLAYVTHDGDSLKVLMTDLNGGGNVIRLFTLATADVFTLAWSPDGSRLLLTATAGTQPVGYILAPLGGDVRELPVSKFVLDIVPHGAWMPDGKRVGMWGGSPGNADGVRITQFGTANSDTLVLAFPLASENQTGSWSHRTNMFALQRSTDSTTELWLSSNSEPPTRIARETNGHSLHNPVWAPDDRAIFLLRDASELVRIPFARNGRATAGPSQVVASGLESWESLTKYSSALSLSDDGTRVAYTRRAQHANIVLLDAYSRARPLTNGTTMKWGGVLAPDGTRLAFVQRDARGDNLWLMDVASGVVRQLTFDGNVMGHERALTVAWSPDGGQLACILRVDGFPHVGVVGVAAGGTLRTIPASRTAAGTGISWAPSTVIYFADKSQRELRAVDPVSETATVVAVDTNAAVYGPTPSDDGQTVAFYKQSYDNAQSGLWIVEVGRPARQIVKGPAYPIGWTADGSAIIAGLNTSSDLLKISLNGRSQLIGHSTNRDDYCQPVRRAPPAGFLCTTFTSVSDAWVLELAKR